MIKHIRRIRNIFINHFRQDNQITYMQAREIMNKNPLAVLLDVRSKQEYDEYHLNGAVCIPVYELENQIESVIEDKNQTIIVYCQSGGRSRKAVNVLKKMGYMSVYEIGGGIDNL